MKGYKSYVNLTKRYLGHPPASPDITILIDNLFIEKSVQK